MPVLKINSEREATHIDQILKRNNRSKSQIILTKNNL